ncbi:MAG: TetR/AcrR family transcriptional regulator [Cellulomonadaceae bacterium]
MSTRTPSRGAVPARTDGRAPRLSPEQRREAIATALAPYVLEHGTDVSTRDLAAAAGVAEGTLFRVFSDKKALIAAAVVEAARQHFHAQPAVDTPRLVREGPLRERLVSMVTEMSRRAGEGFRVVALLHEIDPSSLPEGVTIPGPHHHGSSASPEFLALRQELLAGVVELLGPDAGRLRLPVDQLFDVLRSLAFGRYLPPHVSSQPLSAEDVADLLLLGAFEPDDPGEARASHSPHP